MDYPKWFPGRRTSFSRMTSALSWWTASRSCSPSSTTGAAAATATTPGISRASPSSNTSRSNCANARAACRPRRRRWIMTSTIRNWCTFSASSHVCSISMGKTWRPSRRHEDWAFLAASESRKRKRTRTSTSSSLSRCQCDAITITNTSRTSASSSCWCSSKKPSLRETP